MKRTVFQVTLVIVALGFTAPPLVHSDTISLDAVDAGFVTVAGGSAKGDGTVVPAATYNYSVGQELHYIDGSLGSPPGSTPLDYMDRNNYLVFDLSGIGAPIASATLMLPAGTLESVDSFEVFDLVAPDDPGAALSDAMMLMTANGIGSSEFDSPSDPMISIASALYGNIEMGASTILASTTVTAADDGTTLAIAFDPLGLDYLEVFSGGMLFLGGSVSTNSGGAAVEQPFGGVAPGIPASPPGSDPSVPMLIVTTVPEPGAGLILASSALLFASRRRRS